MGESLVTLMLKLSWWQTHVNHRYWWVGDGVVSPSTAALERSSKPLGSPAALGPSYPLGTASLCYSVACMVTFPEHEN